MYCSFLTKFFQQYKNAHNRYKITHFFLFSKYFGLNICAVECGVRRENIDSLTLDKG